MKLNSHLLKTARNEFDQHLKSDLEFSKALHGFLNGSTDHHTYLSSDYGFKKFLNDYGVVRTLKAGDEAKLKVLQLIKTYPYGKSHVENIINISSNIRMQALSAHSGKAGPGLPQSFASKFLYIYKPDALIPYDSYVLNALQLHFGENVKALALYYARADQFRKEFFPEDGTEVGKKLEKMDTVVLRDFKSLKLNLKKVISWKLTDKYLWCDAYHRKSKVSDRKHI